MNTHGKFHNAFANRSLTIVDFNEAKFQSFSDIPRMIGTQGLRGCFVVLIASRYAAILAHIGPASVTSVMGQVSSLFEAKKQTYFQDKDVWIIMAQLLDASNAALDSAKQVIIRTLAEMGLPRPEDASYSFRLESNGESPEFPDKGTVVVGLVGGRIEAWVENRMLRFW